LFFEGALVGSITSYVDGPYAGEKTLTQAPWPLAGTKQQHSQTHKTKELLRVTMSESTTGKGRKRKTSFL